MSEVGDDIRKAESLFIKTGKFLEPKDLESVQRLRELCCDEIACKNSTQEKGAILSRAHLVYYTSPFLFGPAKTLAVDKQPLAENVNDKKLGFSVGVLVEVNDFLRGWWDELLSDFHDDFVKMFSSETVNEVEHRATIQKAVSWDPIEPLLGNEDAATCKSLFEATVWRPNQAAGFQVDIFEDEGPNLVAKDGTGKALTFVKMWDASLSRVINDNGTLRTDHPYFPSLLWECLGHCLKYEVDMFFISCYTHTIFCQLDLDPHRKPAKHTAVGPVGYIGLNNQIANASFKYALVNIEDPTHTLQALIEASFYRSLKADSTTQAHVKAQCALLGDVKELIRNMFHFSFIPVEKRKRTGYEKTGGYSEFCRLLLFDALQPLQKGPHYFTQVWKVPQKDVSEIFPFLDTSKDIQEDLVVKIWDGNRFEILFAAYAKSKGWTSLEVLQNYVGQLYSNEIACYKRINWYNSKYNTQIKISKLYGYDKMGLSAYSDSYYGNSLIVSYIQQGEYT